MSWGGYGKKRTPKEQVESDQETKRREVDYAMDREFKEVVGKYAKLLKDSMVKQLEEKYEDNKSVWTRADTQKRALFPETELALSCMAVDDNHQDLLWFAELAELLAPAPHVVSLAEDATKLISQLGNTSENLATAMNCYKALVVPRNACSIFMRNTEDPLLLQLAVSLDGTDLQAHVGAETIAKIGMVNRRRLAYYFGKFEDEAGLLKCAPEMERDSALAREALVGACAAGSIKFATFLWPRCVDFKGKDIPKSVFKAKTTMSAWSPFTAACLSGNLMLCKFLIKHTENDPKLAAHMGCHDGAVIVPLLKNRQQTAILALIE